MVTQTVHGPSGDNISQWAEDPVVELIYSYSRDIGKPSVTIPLLPGEALLLARALTRGADVAAR